MIEFQVNSNVDEEVNVVENSGEKRDSSGVLPEVVRRDICKLAQEYEAEKVVLFGSRARGDNGEKSDIDLAVYGCSRFSDFALDVEEKVWTLLTFDIVNMDREVSLDLQKEIERDGVVLYEKV